MLLARRVLVVEVGVVVDVLVALDQTLCDKRTESKVKRFGPRCRYAHLPERSLYLRCFVIDHFPLCGITMAP